MRAVCLLLLAWAFPAAAESPEEARSALTQCIERLRGHEGAGFRIIAEQCPALESSLAGSNVSNWLPDRWWQDRLTLTSLEELAALIDRMEAPAAGTAIDVALLAPVLEEIERAELERRQTLMERFRQWLRERFRPESDDTPRWVQEWGKWLTDNARLVNILSYSLLFLIVALSVYIVVNELRAAGVLNRRPSGERGTLESAHGHLGADALDDLERLELAQRPSRILEGVLAVLAGPSRARMDRARTHRELQRELRFGLPALEQGFSLLAGCAERVRYSPELPPTVELERAVASGRELLASLGRQAYQTRTQS